MHDIFSRIKLKFYTHEKLSSKIKQEKGKSRREMTRVLKFPSNEQWMRTFIEMFDTLAVLYKTSSDPTIAKLVHKFADLRYDLMKNEYLATLKDPSLASHQGMDLILKGFDEVKTAMLKKTLKYSSFTVLLFQGLF